MRKLLKVAAAVGIALLVAAGGFYLWASARSDDLLARTFDTHRILFPVPFPVEEPAQAPEPRVDAVDPAMERAIASGRHLVEARYACIECHGADFGGGVMLDDAAMGRLLGPNLTTGRGSVTLAYEAADWDRIVRHGVRPDGTPAAMPSEDYQLMSDIELSDIVAYIGSLPPVDATVESPQLGPLGKILLATGQLPLSADLIESHTAPHRGFPPEEAVSAEFGRHLAGVCMGCHRSDLAGGPVPAGDPSWPPAANLTPHTDGLAGWDYEDFARAMIEGIRPDGTRLGEPMTTAMPYAANMTDVETRALWAYLESLAPAPDPD